MQKESVDAMLSNYREHRARCEYLECEIPELERLAASMRETMVEDTVSCTQVISDMPRGTSISDPTGRLAMMFASGGVTEHVRQIEEEITEKKRELAQKRVTVIFVGAWLKALNEKERFVVEKQVIDKLFWRDVVRMYDRAFGEAYSKHGLKAIRDAALQKIYRIAS